MKKILFKFIAVAMICSLVLVGCGNSKEQKNEKITFKTKTILDKDIDDSIFKNYDLTLVNVWGTFCDPCLREMPDLQKLYKEMKEKNVNVVGIIGDAVPQNLEETKGIAKEMIFKTGVNYDNIIPDQELIKFLSKNAKAFPTTFFVDKDGTIIGEPVVGARNFESYKKEVENALSKIKK